MPVKYDIIPMSLKFISLYKNYFTTSQFGDFTMKAIPHYNI